MTVKIGGFIARSNLFPFEANNRRMMTTYDMKNNFIVFTL